MLNTLLNNAADALEPLRDRTGFLREILNRLIII